MAEVLKEGDAVQVSAKMLEKEAKPASHQSKSTLRASEAMFLELPNGLNYVFSGKSSAETLFLYDELIERRIYFRNGIAPVVGGYIVDVRVHFVVAERSAME